MSFDSTITLEPRTEDAIADVLADCLAGIRVALEAMADAPPEVRKRARCWMLHLDRATGTEEATTIEDTIATLRAA